MNKSFQKPVQHAEVFFFEMALCRLGFSILVLGPPRHPSTNQPIITRGGLPKLAVCHGYQNFGDQECARYHRRSSAALISGLGLLCRSAAEQTSHGTWDPQWETHTFWFRWCGRQRWGVISGVQLGAPRYYWVSKVAMPPWWRSARSPDRNPPWNSLLGCTWKWGPPWKF